MALPEVELGGVSLDGKVLTSVHVSPRLNAHTWCTIVCTAPEDRAIAIDEMIGRTAQVTCVDDPGNAWLPFSGFVLNVELGYEVAGNFVAPITAVSNSYGLDVSRRKQYLHRGYPAIGCGRGG